MTNVSTIDDSLLPVPLLPRYVANFNAYAARRGFQIGPCNVIPSTIHKYRGANHLMGEWRGTVRQFWSLKFAQASTRIPISIGSVKMRKEAPIRSARISVEGKALRLEPDFGPAPLSLEMRGSVEVIGYEDRIGYYGSARDLVRIGIPSERVTIRSQCNRRSGTSEEAFGRCEWNSAGFADKSVLYIVDTERAVILRQTRQAEFDRQYEAYARKLGYAKPEPEAVPAKPLLRLIIDNTQCIEVPNE